MTILSLLDRFVTLINLVLKASMGAITIEYGKNLLYVDDHVTVANGSTRFSECQNLRLLLRLMTLHCVIEDLLVRIELAHDFLLRQPA